MWRKQNIVVLLFAVMFGHSAQAQSFSADLVSVDVAGDMTGKTGKLSVAEGKVRIDAPDFPGDFFTIDPSAKTAYLVRPKQRIFMDAMQSSRLTQLLVQVDPGDPCKQWDDMAKIAGVVGAAGEWHCIRLDEETLDGRATVKYKVISPRGDSSLAWIDSELKFISRLRGEDGAGIDVTSFKEGPQAESLFAIPANYGKFDPLQLIGRIKQSDVWVEPPK